MSCFLTKYDMRFFLNALLFLGVLFVLLALLYLVGRTFVADQFIIPTWSMAPTLVPGDRVVVNKLLMGGTYIHGLRLPKGRTGAEERTDERTKATEAQRHRGVQLSAGG